MIGFDANSHVYHKEHNGRRNFINRGKEMTAHIQRVKRRSRGATKNLTIRLLQPFSVQGIALLPKIPNAFKC